MARFRLQCYAIENCLVTDECLEVMKTTWPKLKEAAEKWSSENPTHRDATFITELAQAPDRMRYEKIKDIRHLICAIAACNKPWEVVVGQAIAGLDLNSLKTGPTTLAGFIGEPAVKALCRQPLTHKSDR